MKKYYTLMVIGFIFLGFAMKDNPENLFKTILELDYGYLLKNWHGVLLVIGIVCITCSLFIAFYTLEDKENMQGFIKLKPLDFFWISLFCISWISLELTLSTKSNAEEVLAFTGLLSLVWFMFTALRKVNMIQPKHEIEKGGSHNKRDPYEEKTYKNRIMHEQSCDILLEKNINRTNQQKNQMKHFQNKRLSISNQRKRKKYHH